MIADSGEGDFKEPIAIPIEEAIDLHGIPSADLKEVVFEYLRLAQEKGYGRVRLIHGKGIGTRRQMIWKWLRTHPEVVDFKQSVEGLGSWGATLVWLRSSKK